MERKRGTEKETNKRKQSFRAASVSHVPLSPLPPDPVFTCLTLPRLRPQAVREVAALLKILLPVLQNLHELQHLLPCDDGVGGGDGRDYVAGDALGGVVGGCFDVKDGAAEVGGGGDEAHGEVGVFVELDGGGEEVGRRRGVHLGDDCVDLVHALGARPDSLLSSVGRGGGRGGGIEGRREGGDGERSGRLG